MPQKTFNDTSKCGTFFFCLKNLFEAFIGLLEAVLSASNSSTWCSDARHRWCNGELEYNIVRGVSAVRPAAVCTCVARSCFVLGAGRRRTSLTTSGGHRCCERPKVVLRAMDDTARAGGWPCWCDNAVLWGGDTRRGCHVACDHHSAASAKLRWALLRWRSRLMQERCRRATQYVEQVST